jgi:hypothetical protein
MRRTGDRYLAGVDRERHLERHHVARELAIDDRLVLRVVVREVLDDPRHAVNPRRPVDVHRTVHLVAAEPVPTFLRREQLAARSDDVALGRVVLDELPIGEEVLVGELLDAVLARIEDAVLPEDRIAEVLIVVVVARLADEERVAD